MIVSLCSMWMYLATVPGVGGVEPLELVDLVELFRNVSRFDDELFLLQTQTTSNHYTIWYNSTQPNFSGNKTTYKNGLQNKVMCHSLFLLAAVIQNKVPIHAISGVMMLQRITLILREPHQFSVENKDFVPELS